MALSTYSDLTTSVANWFGGRTDTGFTNIVADMVVLAESEIYRRLRVREMETTTTLSTVAGTQTVALPSGFIGVRRLYFTTNPLAEPTYLAPPVFWKTYAVVSSGIPKNFTIEGDNFVFGPTPDAVYSGPLLYYQKLAPLSSSTNNLWARNPDMWLFGSLAQAGMFVADDNRIPIWANRFDAIVDSIQSSSNQDRFSGPPLSARPDMMTP